MPKQDCSEHNGALPIFVFILATDGSQLRYFTRFNAIAWASVRLICSQDWMRKQLNYLNNIADSSPLASRLAASWL
jgi:hypothetical protein